MPAVLLKLLAWATFKVGPWVPGLGAIAHGLKVASYLAILGLGGWGGVTLTNWWHGGKITLAQADKRCADAIDVATLDARRKALDQREKAIDGRAMKVEIDERLLRVQIEQMERDRNETHRAGDDGVLVRADDEWLQRWRGANGGTRGRR